MLVKVGGTSFEKLMKLNGVGLWKEMQNFKKIFSKKMLSQFSEKFFFVDVQRWFDWGIGIETYWLYGKGYWKTTWSMAGIVSEKRIQACCWILGMDKLSNCWMRKLNVLFVCCRDMMLKKNGSWNLFWNCENKFCERKSHSLCRFVKLDSKLEAFVFFVHGERKKKFLW